MKEIEKGIISTIVDRIIESDTISIDEGEYCNNSAYAYAKHEIQYAQNVEKKLVKEESGWCSHKVYEITPANKENDSILIQHIHEETSPVSLDVQGYDFLHIYIWNKYSHKWIKLVIRINEQYDEYKE